MSAKLSVIAIAVSSALLLSACGGGGGGGGGTTAAASSVITGTAAAGAPIIGKVTVKDSLGAQKTVDIEADGTYRVDVADMTGPFDYHLTRRLVALCDAHDIRWRKDVFRHYRSDSASAIEIPPRRPPHHSTDAAPGVSSRTPGTALTIAPTDRALATRVIGIAASPRTRCPAPAASTIISSPISRNRTEFSISSTNSQNLWT